LPLAEHSFTMKEDEYRALLDQLEKAQAPKPPLQ
jgi:hypothetical protein